MSARRIFLGSLRSVALVTQANVQLCSTLELRCQIAAVHKVAVELRNPAAGLAEAIRLQ